MTDRIEPGSRGIKEVGLPASDPVVYPQLKDTLTLPAYDCVAKTIPGEAEKSVQLMSMLEIDGYGIAHEEDEATGTRTHLVAVRISDTKDAEVLPIIKTDDGIAIELPEDRATRVGFFIGSDKSTLAALRQGMFPGLPLTTRSIEGQKNPHEVYINMEGIKPSELEEAFWAEQVRLFQDLGFDPKSTRGIFHRSHLPLGTLDAWKTRPLVFLPDQSIDMLHHFDQEQVRKDRLQIQVYGKKDPEPSYSSLSFRGWGNSDPFGSDNLRFGGMKGLSLGFGSETTQYARTAATGVDRLRGAYQIDIVSQTS